MKQPPIHELKLPRLFVEDHYERGLDTGHSQRWAGKWVFLRCNDAALNEIESDARHYATAFGKDDNCPLNIIASAKRVVLAIIEYRIKKNLNAQRPFVSAQSIRDAVKQAKNDAFRSCA